MLCCALKVFCRDAQDRLWNVLTDFLIGGQLDSLSCVFRVRSKRFLLRGTLVHSCSYEFRLVSLTSFLLISDCFTIPSLLLSSSAFVCFVFFN